MSDTHSDTTPATPADCYVRAAQALAHASAQAGGYAEAQARVADGWMTLAHQLSEHGPAEPITPAAVAGSTLDVQISMARQWPRAFAAAVHDMITEYNGELDKLRAELDETRARSLQHKATAQHHREQEDKHRRAAAAANDRVRSLESDLTRTIDTYDKREAEHEDDKRRIRDALDAACRQIADMHAAACGGEVRGPSRGPVEDVADLFAAWQAAETRAAQLEMDGEREASANLRALSDATRAIGEAHERRTKDLLTVADVADSEARKGASATVLAHYVRIAAEHLAAGHDDRPQSCPTCRVKASQAKAAAGDAPARATEELGRLRSFITKQYPGFATAGPIVSDVTDLLNTLDAGRAVLVGKARALLLAADRVRALRNSDAYRALAHASTELRDVLAAPAPGKAATTSGPTTVVPVDGQTPAVAVDTPTVAHGVPPLGTPTTVGALHITREPAEQAWRDAMNIAAFRQRNGL